MCVGVCVWCRGVCGVGCLGVCGVVCVCVGGGGARVCVCVWGGALCDPWCHIETTMYYCGCKWNTSDNNACGGISSVVGMLVE